MPARQQAQRVDSDLEQPAHLGAADLVERDASWRCRRTRGPTSNTADSALIQIPNTRDFLRTTTFSRGPYTTVTMSPSLSTAPNTRSSVPEKSEVISMRCCDRPATSS